MADQLWDRSAPTAKLVTVPDPTTLPELPTWRRPTDPVGAFVDGPDTLVEGAPDGPLAGRTLAVKDVIDVAGRVTGAGNPVIAAQRPPAGRTAPVVQRLVDAGATVIGRTVTDELAYSVSGTNVHLGTPVNPAYPGHEPGGSSAGSAAAVAARLADLALGTDTGGSIRVPASYCRLCGWRPTHGLIPVDGLTPLSPSFDTVGLFTTGDDPELLGLAADVLAAGLPPAGEVRGIRIATDLVGLVAADDAADVVATAERLAAALGVPVDRRPVLDRDPAEALAAFRTLQSAEAWRCHGSVVTTGVLWPEGDPGDPRPTGPWRNALGLGPGIASRFEAAAKVTPDDEARAARQREAVRDDVLRAAADGWLVAQPAAAGPPIALDTGPEDKLRSRLATLTINAPAGLARVPVVVVPTRPPGRPPLGLALVSAPGTDATLLATAAIPAARL